MAKYKKLNGETVTLKDIEKRMAILQNAKFPVSKWLHFCKRMLEIGYKVSVKETPHTKSKYVKIYGAGDTTFLVRFSDHKPNQRRELAGDCNFFVGRTHTGVRTTAHAIDATLGYFNAL